jgi:hypothetical protein
VIVLATDLLIAAWRTEAGHGGTIEAPELVRILNHTNDTGKSQEARTERLELGRLSRLEQYVSNELAGMANGCDLPG